MKKDRKIMFGGSIRQSVIEQFEELSKEKNVGKSALLEQAMIDYIYKHTQSK